MFPLCHLAGYRSDQRLLRRKNNKTNMNNKDMNNQNTPIIKKLQQSTDLLITFTEEELESLGLTQGDKFSVYHQDDGSILLEKFVTLELETEEWPRHILEHLIKVSCEKDVSVNEVINDFLAEFLEISGYTRDGELIDEDEEDFDDYQTPEDSNEDLEALLQSGQITEEEAMMVLQELGLAGGEQAAASAEEAPAAPAEEAPVASNFHDESNDEFDEGLAFIPMSVYTKLERIISEYNSRKQTLGFKTEPNLRTMAEFLSISYGSSFPENQVKAVVEMKNQEEDPTEESMINLNFHQRVQNIIFGAEELEQKLGKYPSVWELTDALVRGGIDVKRSHVAAILEIDKESREKKCCGGKCSPKISLY